MRHTLGAAALVATCGLLAAHAHAGPMSGRFTPPDGTTLLVVGQDLGAVAGYTAHVHAAPGGVTSYTSLFTLDGLETTANWGSGEVNARICLETYPTSALVLGLYMVEQSGDELNRAAEGAYDLQIDRLGRFIQASRRPVYLRIGYEFDGPWNHYVPREYVAVFRRIVDRLRSAGVEDFATVWQSAANVTFEDRSFGEWWPGDEYVDWVGSTFFFPDENRARHGPLIRWASDKGKPLMICEATPRGYNVDESPDGPPPRTYPDRGLTFSRDGTSFTPRSAEQIWNDWYAAFFDLVRGHAHVVRAAAYINVEWNAQPMWGDGGDGYWGDSRIESNQVIRRLWLAEITGRGWQHGGEELFDILRGEQESP